VANDIVQQDPDDLTAAVDVEQDVSFDVELDPEPGEALPQLVDDGLRAGRDDRRPIIPLHLRTPAGIAHAAKVSGGRQLHRAGWHGVRLPLYLPLGLFWAVIGVFRLLGWQIRWWWHPELSSLLQHAANVNDPKEGREIHRHLSNARQARGLFLAGELVAVLVAVVLLLTAAPWWVFWLVAAVALPVLARIGHPADRPIIGTAVVVPRYRRINADVVLRAYYKAKLGNPDKPDEEVKFGSQMSRDRYDRGSQVMVILPHGVTFSLAMASREKLASGLDVSLSQVYLSRDKTSNRRHMLYVADVDPLSIPAGRTPLLDCKPRDIWNAAPLGLDERGRRVLLPLMWTSVLIGAQPRKGKTFTARALALYAALDPYVRLSVFDLKGSPDWRKFALVAYTYGFGMLADRVQGDPMETLRATLRAAKKEVQLRNVRLSELPTAVCPEGKLTRDIARDRRYGMPVWVIVLDEFQDALNSGDEEYDREVADLMVFLIKQGPSTGVLFIDSTQRPSGIGSTGRVAKLFTDFRDNHQTRFSLKTGSWQVSNLVLGGDAYSEGFDSSSLPVGDGTNGTYDYRGIGILYDGPVENATVRCYLADGEDAEKILHAARQHRERAGTLDGMAAGDEITTQARDPLADSLDAFGASETALSWQQLAERLAEQLPERYADITPAALSATLTGMRLGIESKNVRVGDKVPKGVHRAALQRAIERRDGDENR
jgi:hypothetical protein